MRKSIAALAALLSAGCQTFVDVNTLGRQPVFSWRADAPVKSLTVLADDACELVHGPGRAERVWWQISGTLKPPITYGVVPKGAAEVAGPRPWPRECAHWTVTVTDGSTQGESATFRF
jgi:hypothetical protein